ncbi:hypothetical protein AAG747_09650 [Rapidithrix thailandica]|uniref:N-acetyltransferase domain-containing protein n=1 Tax=Rapidithrix thailandica TaxID=413964 RepID=A0AAW9RTT5_9BACT
MKIIEVNDPKLVKEFLQVPVKLYKNDSYWIRPLDKDIEEVFDPKKNKMFRHGECARFILRNGKNEAVGRVAVFVNKRTANKDNDQPTGGMGFFDCINDQEAANMLFDTCKAWLEERGMEAMDGPVNFGERDKWWGCLVQGFTEPNYCMPYNFPYYKELFENYGFREYFQQFTFGRKVQGHLDERIFAKANRIYNNPDYEFRHINLKEIEKYAEDFRAVYNKAWVKHAGVGEMPKAQAMNIMRQMKPVIDEEIIWFGYYKGEPIAFWIQLPELNQLFKHLNGQFNWWAKLKFLYYQKFVGANKLFGVAFGITPAHQGKGVEAALIVAYQREFANVENYRYKDVELNWIGDFNPKMIRICEQIGAEVKKTHVTFRKLFDETKEFKRMKVIK